MRTGDATGMWVYVGVGLTGGDPRAVRVPDRLARYLPGRRVQRLLPPGACAAGESANILLHRPLLSVGVSIRMWRGRQHNDRTLADGAWLPQQVPEPLLLISHLRH